MAKVRAGMTTSLDGFVADPNGSATRLYPDLEALRGTDYMNALIDATGGRHGEEDLRDGRRRLVRRQLRVQVPIFVLTHHPPDVAPRQDEHLTFTFVSDGVESAIDQARAAAGDKAVQVVGGVEVIRQLFAGLVDELHVDVMPVLLGSGLRLFEGSDLEHVRLAKLGVRESGERTSLTFRVET